MKEFITALLFASCMALGGCGEQSSSAANSKTKLESGGYTVTEYSLEQAKQKIQNLNYEGADFTSALFAEKGQDKDHDILLAFYFPSIKSANEFVDKNSSENLGLMNSFAEKELGENLKVKVGVHNNVAYCGSETSFTFAF